MLVDMIVTVIGDAPVGWEFVPYLLAAVSYVVGIWIVWRVISIPLSMLRR